MLPRYYGPLAGIEGSAAAPLSHRVAKLLPLVERSLAAAERVVKAKRAAAYEASRAGRYLNLASAADANDGVLVGGKASSEDDEGASSRHHAQHPRPEAPLDDDAPPDMPHGVKQQERSGEPLGALVAALGAKVEAVGTCAQDHVDHEVGEFLEQLRYQRALAVAARDATDDRLSARKQTDKAKAALEKAIQQLAAARAGGVDGSAKVHVATARLEASKAQRDASVARERQIDDTLRDEAGRFERGRALELRGALLEYAATNLGFVKRNAATWHQLLESMQPTDAELKESRARVSATKVHLGSAVPPGGAPQTQPRDVAMVSQTASQTGDRPTKPSRTPACAFAPGGFRSDPPPPFGGDHTNSPPDSDSDDDDDVHEASFSNDPFSLGNDVESV